MTTSQERSRRAKRRIAISATVYVPALLAAARIDALPPWVRTLLVTITLLSGLAMIVFGVQAGRHGDELERLMHLEALAVAFVGLAGLGLIAMIVPLGLDTPIPERIAWIDLWVILSVLWTGGLAWAHRRHR